MLGPRLGRSRRVWIAVSCVCCWGGLLWGGVSCIWGRRFAKLGDGFDLQVKRLRAAQLRGGAPKTPVPELNIAHGKALP